MIVDNNLVSLMLFKKHFSPHFVSVETANAYGDMLGLLVSGRQPDMILADFDLSQVSGLELLKALKNDRFLQHIPIILMAVNFSERMISSAMQAGASACIMKPLSTADYPSFCKDILNLMEEADTELAPAAMAV